MSDTATPPGWYAAPDNPVMVRFWDGEVWTESIRPSPHGAIGAGQPPAPDYHVQTSELVAAQLAPGEVIDAGVRSYNSNTMRRVYAVATDQRLLIVFCKAFRSKRAKRVVSIGYDDIAALGLRTSPLSEGRTAVVAAGGETYEIPPVHGIEAFVAYVRTRMNDDTAPDIDLRTLPKPRSTDSAIGFADHHAPIATVASAPPAAGPGLLGVADEIRKLGELRDEGALTDAEFDAQKRRLLRL